MRSLWILLAALALSLPAPAQPADHPYFPLAVGNTWIHDVYGNPGGHRTTTVLGWEGEGAEAFWRVGVSFTPFDGSAPSESECAVRIVLGSNEHQYVEVTTLSGEECGTIEVEPALPSSGSLGEVTVTAQTYTLRLASISGQNAAGILVGCARLAENVGLFSRSACPRNGGGNYLTQHLVYAEVGETTYGTHPDDFFAVYDPMQYMPLAVGNRWTYSVLVLQRFGMTDTYLKDYLITGSDDNTGHYDLTLTHYEEGEVAATYSCEIWMDPSGYIRLSGDNSCVLPTPYWSFRLIGVSTFESYDISDIPYSLLTRSFFFSQWRDCPSTCPIETMRYRSAHGIGLLYYEYYYKENQYPFPDRDVYTLLYADTGEAVYGVNTVASEDAPAAPDQRLALSGHPNPFSGSAEIAFHLPAPGTARLAVYDVLGREVAVLADGRFDAGDHTARLDGTGLPSGVYLVRVEDGTGAFETQRVTLVR